MAAASLTCFLISCMTLLLWTLSIVSGQEGAVEPRVYTREVNVDKCTSGVPGPPGPPGPPGQKGEDGPEIEAVPNWRSCEWTAVAGGNDNAQVLSCAFTKYYTDTYLYVGISSDMRTYNHNSYACCRWYFTFNGNECSNPVKIEAVNYVNSHYHYMNMHRPRMLLGCCKGIGAGSITVGFHVGPCSGYGTYDCYTCWNSSYNMWIEEVPPSPYD